MTQKPARPDMSWLGRMLRAPGRSQTALAAHLGLDKGAITRIIQGKRAVKVEERDAIDEYLRKTEDGRSLETTEPGRGYAEIAAMPEHEGVTSKELMLEMMDAQSNSDDPKFVNAAIGNVGDHMLQFIFGRLVRDGADLHGLTHMLIAHRMAPNLRFLFGLMKCVGKIPEEQLSGLEHLIDETEDLPDLSEMNDEDFNAYYSSIVRRISAPSDRLEVNRATYGLLISVVLYDIGTGFNGRARSAAQRVADSFMRDSVLKGE